MVHVFRLVDVRSERWFYVLSMFMTCVNGVPVVGVRSERWFYVLSMFTTCVNGVPVKIKYR